MALLRKAELHPAVRNWTPGRLAANLIHKFRFDGIRYDRCVDTSTGALPLVLDLQSEVPKMALVWQFIEGKMVHNFHMSQIRSLDRVTIRHILIRDGGTGCAWTLHGLGITGIFLHLLLIIKSIRASCKISKIKSL